MQWCSGIFDKVEDKVGDKVGQIGCFGTSFSYPPIQLIDRLGATNSGSPMW